MPKGKSMFLETIKGFHLLPTKEIYLSLFQIILLPNYKIEFWYSRLYSYWTLKIIYIRTGLICSSNILDLILYSISQKNLFSAISHKSVPTSLCIFTPLCISPLCRPGMAAMGRAGSGMRGRGRGAAGSRAAGGLGRGQTVPGYIRTTPGYKRPSTEVSATSVTVLILCSS